MLTRRASRLATLRASTAELREPSKESTRVYLNLRRAGLTTAWILFAAIIALYVIPSPWEGEGGRDFRPPATVLAIILLASATVFRFWLRWSWASLLGGLALIEGLSLLTIAYFSGADLFSMFNMRWFAYVNIYIGLPWLTGVAIGSGILRLRSRQQA